MSDESAAEEERPPYLNEADEQQQGASKKEKERNLDRIERFWERVMADPDGRETVWGMLVDTGTFTTHFGVGPNGFPNSDETMFLVGQREAGQRLYRTLLKVDPVAVALMHSEHDGDFQESQKRKRRRKQREA